MEIIMSNEAVNFKIVPSVVRANEETTLKIYSYNARFGFFDDITYNIVFTPMEESDVPQDEFEKYLPSNLGDLFANFREYKI